jgi:hypothetical protein
MNSATNQSWFLRIDLNGTLTIVRDAVIVVIVILVIGNAVIISIVVIVIIIVIFFRLLRNIEK